MLLCKMYKDIIRWKRINFEWWEDIKRKDMVRKLKWLNSNVVDNMFEERKYPCEKIFECRFKK